MVLVCVVDLLDVLGHLRRPVYRLLDHRVRVVVKDGFASLRRRSANHGRASDIAHNTRCLNHDLAVVLFRLAGA